MKLKRKAAKKNRERREIMIEDYINLIRSSTAKAKNRELELIHIPTCEKCFEFSIEAFLHDSWRLNLGEFSALSSLFSRETSF